MTGQVAHLEYSIIGTAAVNIPKNVKVNCRIKVSSDFRFGLRGLIEY